MTALSIGVGLIIFVAICWLAWKAGMVPKAPYPEDGGANVADERIDSIRQSLDGERQELRASDFAALDNPHPHVRAFTEPRK